MTFISEQTIDQEASKLDASQQLYDDTLEQIKEQQPHVALYLMSESFELLTPKEQDYLLYLALVIWRAISQKEANSQAITEEQIGQHDEKNWELMEQSSNKKFRERLDVFFKDTPQEDLLAYIEDSLTIDSEDQEDFLTKAGREIIFVGLKTLVDVLT